MVDNVNFSGIHTAQCRGLLRSGSSKVINFYQVSKDDEKLLNKLNELDFGTILSSDNPNSGFDFIAKDVFSDASDNKFKSFLAVVDNKPCGCIAGFPLGERLYVSRMIAWPMRSIGKVKNVGDGLLNILLKSAKDMGVKKAEVDAISPKYSNCLSFYKRNGFEKTKDKLNPNVDVPMKLRDINQYLQNKKMELYIRFLNSKENVDLSNLDLNF